VFERVGCGEEWRLDRCFFCHGDFEGLGDFPCEKNRCRARSWDRLRCPSCGRWGRQHRETDFVPGNPPEPPAGYLGAALLQVPEIASLIETDQDGVLSQAGLRAFLDEIGVRRGSSRRRLCHQLVTHYARERRRAIADRPKPKATPNKNRRSS